MGLQAADIQLTAIVWLFSFPYFDPSSAYPIEYQWLTLILGFFLEGIRSSFIYLDM